MTLCKYCNNLHLPSYWTVERSKGGKVNYDELSVIPSTGPRGLKPHINIARDDLLYGASEMHCDACALLRDALLVMVNGSLDEIVEISVQGNQQNTLSVTVKMKRGHRYFELYTIKDFPSPWPIIGPGRPVSTTSSSQACLELAASWIQDCVKDHEECQHPAHTPLPTRVVNVGNDETEPFLYVTKQENAKYIALSHCWGGKVSIMTTLETFEQRRRAIRISELPKTFKDAIRLTRKLGVQYLWIDSLCIIQNSEQDWIEEAANMGAVYRNCLVCIAADGATDSNGGCFIESPSKRNLDLACLEFEKATKLRGTVHIREEPLLGAFAHVKRTTEPYESKLDTRGWALQEHALAPRTLHYTMAELAWDCAKHIKCECTILPQDVGPLYQLQSCKHMMRHSAHLSEDGESKRSMWPNFVELATKRSLTYESDRLHALSGIAKVISRPQYGPFLAGLWKAELPLTLLWQIVTRHTKGRLRVVSRRHRPYYAPSWTWASVTGPVVFLTLPGRPYNFELIPDLTIVEAVCEPASVNSYGPVQSGHLKVTGLIAPYEIGTRVRKSAQPSIDSREQTLPAQRGFDCDVLDGENRELADDEPLWMLLVAHGERRKPGLSRLEGYHCIVLRKSQQGQNAFERVGSCWGLKEIWANDLLKKAKLQTIFLY